jgi:hypothetical protein
MGPRAMLAAGAVGAGFGLTEGCLTWTVLKLSGESIEQRYAFFRELEESHLVIILEEVSCEKEDSF